MTYRRQLLAAFTLLMAVLPYACSKKSSDDSGGTGGTDGGTITGTITGSAGAGTNTNGAFNPKITGEDASSTTDGTSSITAASAQNIISNAATACNGQTVEAEAQPAIIEFVIDISGSMGKTTKNTNGVTKWELTKKALDAAVKSLPASAAVGITFFPNMAVASNPAITTAQPLSACVNTASDVAIGYATAAQITNVQSAIDGIVINGSGATPTYDAYSNAVTQLKNTKLGGNKYIVFITDGQPTVGKDCIGDGSDCTPLDAQPIIDAIAAARKDSNISTFVVGSPGSEVSQCTGTDLRGWLSAAATAGATAATNCNDAGPTYCHFDLSTATDFGTALTTALNGIVGSLLECQYTVPTTDSSGASITLDPGLVNMIYQDGNGAYSVILPQATATCDKGWDYTDSSLSEVRICGTTCDLFQKNPNATLTLVFGCTTEYVLQ